MILWSFTLYKVQSSFAKRRADSSIPFVVRVFCSRRFKMWCVWMLDSRCRHSIYVCGFFFSNSKIIRRLLGSFSIQNPCLSMKNDVCNERKCIHRLFEPHIFGMLINRHRQLETSKVVIHFIRCFRSFHLGSTNFSPFTRIITYFLYIHHSAIRFEPKRYFRCLFWSLLIYIRTGCTFFVLLLFAFLLAARLRMTHANCTNRRKFQWMWLATPYQTRLLRKWIAINHELLLM